MSRWLAFAVKNQSNTRIASTDLNLGMANFQNLISFEFFNLSKYCSLTLAEEQIYVSIVLV